MPTIPDADRHERRFHHQTANHAKAAMSHRDALRRWILVAAASDVPLVEIAEAAGTTVERIQDIIDRDRMLAEENQWP